MTAVLDVLSAVLLIAGAALGVLGAVGLLRFPDALARLHSAAKPQALGLILVLLGTAFQVPGTVVPALLVVALLQMTTGPVAAQIMARTVNRTPPRQDDLGE